MRQVILILLLLLFSSSVYAERRSQIWNKNDILIHPWKYFDLNVAEKIQYSPQNNAVEQKYGELFVIHKPLTWFDYGLGYRVSYSNVEIDWVQENRAMLVAEFKQQYHNFWFKFSNRFEYRNYKVELDHFRYKQQFTVTFPSLASWGMQFYTSEESFTKLNGVGTHLARLYGGISGVHSKHFQLKLYYAFEKYKLIENWNSRDIMGLNLSFIL